VLLKKEVDRTQ